MENEKSIRLGTETYSPENLAKIWDKFNQNLAQLNNVINSQNLDAAIQKQDDDQQKPHSTNVQNSLK